MRPEHMMEQFYVIKLGNNIRFLYCMDDENFTGATLVKWIWD